MQSQVYRGATTAMDTRESAVGAAAPAQAGRHNALAYSNEALSESGDDSLTEGGWSIDADTDDDTDAAMTADQGGGSSDTAALILAQARQAVQRDEDAVDAAGEHAGSLWQEVKRRNEALKKAQEKYQEALMAAQKAEKKAEDFQAAKKMIDAEKRKVDAKWE